MNTTILKLAVLAILLLTTSMLVQRGPGNSRQAQRPMQGQRELPKFNAENAVGILKYDYEKVIKKTKVKKDTKKNKVTKIIADYNHSIAEIMFLHTDEFRAIEKFVAIKRETAKANRDREAMPFIQQEAMEKLIPIKHKVRNADRVLNDKLELILSEKQLQKWHRLQRTRKESLQPKRPENTREGRPQQRGPRNR